MNRKSALRAFAMAGRLTDDEYQSIGRQRIVFLGKMTDNGRAWIKAHPEAHPQITFTVPMIVGKQVAIVGTVEDSVELGYIKCDEAGLELIKALYPWGQPETPTYAMVKEVIERLYAAS